MADKSTLEQVGSGFRTAGNVLLCILVGGMLFGGAATVYSPEGHQSIVGWACFVAATVVLALTVSKWVNALPGILNYGAIGALIVTVDGHLLNNPRVPINRAEGIALVLFAIGSSALSVTFRKRSLSYIDKAALLGFVFSLVWGAAYDSARVSTFGKTEGPSAVSFISIGMAFCCLLLGWAYDRLARRHRSEHGSSNPDHVMV